MYEQPDGTKHAWEDLSEETQDDLLEWFNRVEPSDEDKARLAKLWSDGDFDSWDCPGCGDRVYDGEPHDERDWAHFQGVKTADYVSYPGRQEYKESFNRRLCNICRCYGAKAHRQHGAETDTWPRDFDEDDE